MSASEDQARDGQRRAPSPLRRPARIGAAVEVAARRRAGTARLVAAAVCAWSAALRAPTAEVEWMLWAATAVVCAVALVLLPRAGGVAGAAFAGAAAGLLTAVRCATLRTGLPPSRVEGLIVVDPAATQSGRVRADVALPRGTLTLVSDDPLPPAGTRIRAEVDPWGEDIAGVEELEVTGGQPRLWRLRALAREQLSASADDPAGERLLPGLVIGDTSGLDAELGEAMREVSLSHLTAVSGANIVIVAGAVFVCAALLTPHTALRLVPSALIAAAYVFIVGPEPSVIRASGMAVLAGILLLRSGGTPTVAVLASALTCLLIAVPSLAAEPAFALSASATAAIVLLAPPMTAQLARLGCPTPLGAAVTVPLAAQLGCTPVLIALTPAVSAWAVGANLAAAPAVAPATVLGLAALAVRLIARGAESLGLDIAAALCDGLGDLFAGTGAVFALWIVRCAEALSALPGAVIAWPAGTAGIALAAVAVGCALVAAAARSHLRTVALVAVFALIGVGVSLPEAASPGRGDWRLFVCDVGQGSATLIRGSEAARGAAVLVDAGPDPRALEMCLGDAGVTSLTVLISHFDDDHVGGLSGVGDRAAALAVPTALAGTAEAAEASRTVPEADLLGLAAGDVLTAAGVEIEVLSPPATAPAGDGNAASLVVRADTGDVSALVPGDIGAPEQRALAGAAGAVDVLIAPHHGSGDLDPAFYRRSEPRLGIVSAGADNPHGHPTEKALAAFGRIPVVRTDLCGSAAVAAGLRVRTADGCLDEAEEPPARP